MRLQQRDTLHNGKPKLRSESEGIAPMIGFTLCWSLVSLLDREELGMTPECTYRWAKNSGSYPHTREQTNFIGSSSSVAHHRWLIISGSSSVGSTSYQYLRLETGHTYSIFSTASTVMAQWTTCPRSNHHTNKSLSNDSLNVLNPITSVDTLWLSS